MSSSLGKLVAAVALDAAEFVQGADKAKITAASMATDIDKSLRGVENSVKSTIGTIGTALAAGFGLNALRNAFDGYAEGAAKMGDLAAKAGTTVEKLSGIAVTAKLSGTSIDDVAAAMEKLSRGMVNAAGGTGTAGKALDYLGISTKDSSGRLKDSATITEEVAQKLALMQDGAAKTAIVMDLYGKAGANVIPVLRDLAEYGVQNAAITTQQAAAARAYQEDLARLGMAKEALVRIISSEVLPVADAVVKTFLNMQTQTGGVRDKAQALAQDGSIRSWAMSAVNFIGLVMNAGDGVVRVFEGIGEQIGYFIARTVNAVGSVGKAFLDFVSGEYLKAIQDVAAGTQRDASIVIEHGTALRAVFEKPLAGDVFVNSVTQNLAKVDEATKKTAEGGKKSGSDYAAGIDLMTAAMIKAQAAAAKMTNDSNAALQTAMSAAALRDLETAYKSGLVNIQAYYQTKAALAQKDVDTAVAAARANYAALNQEQEALEAKNVKGKEAQQVAIRLAALEGELNVAANKVAEAELNQNKVTELLIAGRKAYLDAIMQTVDPLLKENEKLKEEIETWGMTTQQVTLYTKARLEARLAVIESMPEYDAEDQAVQGLVASLKAQIAVYDQIAQKQDVVKSLKDQTAIWTDLSAKAGQFFGDLAVNGGKAFDSLKAQLKSFAQQLIAFFAQQFILRIIATGAAGTVTGAAASAAAQGATNSLTGTVVGAAGNYLAGTAAGAAATGFYAGAASAASEAAIGASFVGPSATLASGAVGAGAEAYSAIASALGSIPVYGWIALAVIAIAAYLGGKGGGPKTGGSFMGAFDSAGNLTGSVPVPGSDNGRFYTPDQGDSQLKPLVQGISTGVATALTRYGGSSSGFHFGLGFDNDPQGTAQSRVSSMVTDSAGRLLYRTQDVSMDDKAVPAALQLEASRMILVALQNSQLPQYLANVFKGVNAVTATQAQIDDLFKLADALKSIFDVTSRSIATDFSTLMAQSSDKLTTSLKNNANAVASVVAAYDGSATAATNLQQATYAYYNAQLQLLSSIQSIRQSIGDTFGNTIRGFRLSGMDKQQQYDFYKNEAAALQQQALSSSDPDTVKALSDKINADMQAAFNLLSPEDQAGALGQSFISQGSAAATAIDKHLGDLQKAVVDATQAVLKQINDAITANADSQSAAAAIQNTAANTNLAAANTPLTLNVNLNGPVPQVTAFTG